MALYTVIFTEQGGYQVQCRIRAAAVADHVVLAVQKVWGSAAVWVWAPDSATEGRVYVSVGDDEDDLIPRTAPTTVAVQAGTRRRRGAYSGPTAPPCGERQPSRGSSGTHGSPRGLRPQWHGGYASQGVPRRDTSKQCRFAYLLMGFS